MAKKKKSQLKPVARGFTTTSQPKKVVEVERAAENVEGQPDNADGASVENNVEPSGSGEGFSKELITGPSQEKMEEQVLRDLIDKLQEKTEKEVSRTVKSVEGDRRFSKGLPHLELPNDLKDQVLRLVLDYEPIEGSAHKAVDEPEEKAMARLGVTYGTLRRLGFSEGRVEECLRAIRGVDLEEAYDWLYLHCTEEELEWRTQSETQPRPSTPRVGEYPQLPPTPRSPAEFLSPPTPPVPKIASNPDVQAPAFRPSMKSSSSSPNASSSEMEKASLKSRILASVNRSASPSENGYDSSDPEDPVAEYVRLKMRLTDLTARGNLNGQSVQTSAIETLRARLETVKKHYFFNEQDAEAQFRAERRKADEKLLQSRLREGVDANTADGPSGKAHEKPLQSKLRDGVDNAGDISLGTPAKRTPSAFEPPRTSSPHTTPDPFEGDSDDSAGGMFELLESIPETEINNDGKTVHVRDMALPKHWSGRTPKVLLSETVVKSDRFAAITYRVISGQSRAKRAAVTIRDKEWHMEDVACHDEKQAINYVATVALHALTFPSTEGFAGGASGSPGNQTVFRLLPPVFRDLWDELEEARKKQEDVINRAVWAKLGTILEPKLEKIAALNGKPVKQSVDSRDISAPRATSASAELAPEQIMAGFRARQSSVAYQEMKRHRDLLPIAQYRNEILSTLERSQVLVLSGETGCGKSTQVPAFILEDQLSKGLHCKIYCTEPRRISAISLAQRVSLELGDPPGAVGTLGSPVGYSIRLESNTTRNTRLAFVTNGIALRMLEGGSGYGGQGTAFDEITHIIIDEVHERTIESDFLMIVLKSLLKQRKDLKVILMSATVDAEKIAEFFGGCPTLLIPGRTFPVDVRYLEDAVELAQWIVSDNSPYARRRHDKFYNNKTRAEWSEDVAGVEDDDDENIQQSVKLEKRYSAKTAATINLLDERLVPYDLIISLLERICFFETELSSYSAAVLIFMPGMAEIRRLSDLLAEHKMFGTDNFKLYPLHSTLSSEDQSAVFEVPPFGVRKIVIATNIAETGITIPDITCVIDTGKHREMRFDEKRQISRLVETFISKSNAAQRRGRAGRVQQGLCFHLFTKLRYDTLMAEHPLPEMLRLSLSDLALRIKIMKVKLGNSIEDVLSRALDPPAPINVQRAVSMLVEVRALTSAEEITPMGRLLSKLPTDVHLGKFLLIATLFRCLDPALTIAAALNSKSPFVSPFGLEHEADRARASFRVENSDFLTIHNAFSSWRRACAKSGFARKFCRSNFLSYQNLQQIEELRQQFLGFLVDSSFIQVENVFVKELSRARYGRHRNRFVTVPPELDRNSNNPALIHAALIAGLYPKVLSIDFASGQMRTVSNNQPAYFHPSSVNFGRKVAEFGAHYLSYFTLMHSKKLYAWETAPVDDLSLPLLCGEADFKLISDSIYIDRNKIKFRIDAKSNVALKHLRLQLGSLLSQQFRGKPLTESQTQWYELAVMALGKLKFEDGEEDHNR